MRYLEQSNLERLKVAQWLPVAGRLRKWDLLFNEYKVETLGMLKNFWRWVVVMVAQQCGCT